jgi:glycerol transport system ATP-binding protein
MSLRLEAITKNVGAETHLFPMSLTLEPGLNVLLGPTLAGKTSLMRLMAGLDRPTSGRVLEADRDVTSVPVQKRSVAFVYQQFVNYPSFTVFENIASPLRIRGNLNDTEIKQRVQTTAELLHLEGMLTRLPAQLSGGQQQRTAIARALVKEADLLLLDEPLVNLDYKLREELRTEMREIFARRNAVVVYATTEPLEALQMGGHIAVLDQGRLLQSGPTLEVYHLPSELRVGEVFSDPPMNLIALSLAQGAVRLVNGVTFPVPAHMQSLPDASYRLGVRANHASLSARTPSDVQVPARVELAEISGSETYVHTSLEGSNPGEARVVAQLEGIHSYAIQQAVTLYLDPRRLFAFDSGGQLMAAPPRVSNATSSVQPSNVQGVA